MTRLVSVLLITFAWASFARTAGAQVTRPTTRASITLATGTEEGKKMLVATVTAGGKPVVGAKVEIFIRTTFGQPGWRAGEEETLDDGTAAVPFPEDMPGGTSGGLRVLARIKSPAAYAGLSAEATVAGGVVIPPDPDPFPRKLWSPHAPWPLLLTIVVLLGGVWCTFAFVLVQLSRIRKGD